MTLTLSMTELDEICEYALSYEIRMINDRNGIIELFSLGPIRDNELSQEGIYLFLDVVVPDAPIDGEEYFRIDRMFRRVIRNPHEKNSSEEVDISFVDSAKAMNDLIFKNMKARGEN